mmetsp:Transcript_93938/g.239128  ORF Transcript_93938/g.239128 Transcript_93938/m.239128 type:complete len:289 (+) Transcript_93938:293-1159(+)
MPVVLLVVLMILPDALGEGPRTSSHANVPHRIDSGSSRGVGAVIPWRWEAKGLPAFDCQGLHILVEGPRQALLQEVLVTVPAGRPSVGLPAAAAQPHLQREQPAALVETCLVEGAAHDDVECVIFLVAEPAPLGWLDESVHRRGVGCRPSQEGRPRGVCLDAEGAGHIEGLLVLALLAHSSALHARALRLLLLLAACIGVCGALPFARQQLIQQSSNLHLVINVFNCLFFTSPVTGGGDLSPGGAQAPLLRTAVHRHDVQTLGRHVVNGPILIEFLLGQSRVGIGYAR